jgi:predicted PurR-regulated permease PerM
VTGVQTCALPISGFPAWLAWPTAFALIGAALYFAAAVLANEAVALAAQAPKYLARLESLWATRFPFKGFIPAFDIQSLLKDSMVAGMLGRAVASIGDTLLDLVLVAIYVGFLLAEQPYLPTKLARLQRNDPKAEGEKLVDAIGQQIKSYVGVCTLLSSVMGLVCFVLLSALGVDFAGFWALVIFLLTYIPTVGGIGVALPALMALAQFGSVEPAALILLVLGVAHFVTVNIIETIMLGRTLNLSPFAIILSLTFWGLIWGIGGLFLAVPLTGAVTIICRHLEGLEWIADLIAGPPPRARARHIGNV